MRYILRIFKSIFRWMPGEASLTAADYLFGGLVPAIITVISAGMFDSAAAVLGGEDVQGRLFLYAGLYLAVYLVNDFAAYFRSITLNAGIYEKGTAFFRIDLYEKLARLPLIAFEDAEMLNRKARAERAVNDETLSSLCNHSMRFLRSAISLVSVAAVLASYSVILLPLAFLSVLPYLIARMARGKEFFYVKQHQAKGIRMLSYLWELFTTRQTAKEIRVTGSGEYITDKWRATRDQVNEQLWGVEKKDAVSLLWCDALRILGYGISVGIVVYLALSGQVSIGVFGAAMAAFLSLQNSMQNFLENLGRFPEQLSYAQDYYSFFDIPDETGGDRAFPGTAERIELKNVCFRYPNCSEYALKSVDMTIRRGEKIVILGENGSGKTTLTRILLGLYLPESGEVLYDGVPVGEFTRDSFLRAVSAIAQDFVRYSLTLRENVAISDIAGMDDDAAIIRALHDAGAADGTDPDEMMGREFGGRELSGGQWQKLAIARGLFRDSQIILLDEPTSALDPLVETEILTKFIAAAHNKTALIISHRVGLCRMVDRIVVMKDGEIAETGSHSELIKAGGEYARLFTAQEKWYI